MGPQTGGVFARLRAVNFGIEIDNKPEALETFSELAAPQEVTAGALAIA